MLGRFDCETAATIVAGVNAGVVVERAAPIDGDAGAFCEFGEDNTAEAPMEVTNPDGTATAGGSSAGASWDGAAVIAEVVDAGAFYKIGEHNNAGEANPTANAIYSETEVQLLSSIAEEAATLFPIGKVYESPQSLCKNIAGEVKCWGVLVVRQQLPLLLEEKSLITAQ